MLQQQVTMHLDLVIELRITIGRPDLVRQPVIATLVLFARNQIANNLRRRLERGRAARLTAAGLDLARLLLLSEPLVVRLLGRLRLLLLRLAPAQCAVKVMR